MTAFRHRHRDSLSKQHLDTYSQPVRDKEKNHSTLKFLVYIDISSLLAFGSYSQSTFPIIISYSLAVDAQEKEWHEKDDVDE